MHIDPSGEFFLLIVTVAVYAWMYLDAKKIIDGTVFYDKIDRDIKNSYQVQNPTVMLGYSIYLRYFSKDNNDFSGSAVGIYSEWLAHNLLYNILLIPTELNLINDGFLHSAKHAGVGETIYDELDNTLNGNGIQRLGVFAISYTIEFYTSVPSLIYDTATYMIPLHI